MDDKLVIAIWVIGAAVILQMLFLAGMFFSVRKLAAKLEAVTTDLQSRVLPLLDEAKPLLEHLKGLQEQVKAALEVSRPKVDVILDNASHISTTARANVERVNVTVNDVLDRVRLQVIRADEMVTRTMDRVEETGEKVQHTVLSPVRKVNGVLAGISAGMEALFGRQKQRSRNGGSGEEMFI